MYCPKCGQQAASDELKFCSHCGFGLGVVKASLAGDGEGHAAAVAEPTWGRPTPPRQSETGAGVILMSLGALVTAAAVAVGDTGYIRWLDLGAPGAFLILTITFILILTFSQPLTRLIDGQLSGDDTHGRPPLRRREACFGAALMYAGTILSACAASMFRGPLGTAAFFIALFAVFVFLLLTSHRLMRAVQNMLAGDERAPAGFPRPHALPAGVAQALPPARAEGVPFPASGWQWRADTAEMARPPSVAENTTTLLENK